MIRRAARTTAVVALLAALAPAADDDAAAKKRPEIMQAAVTALEAKSADLKPEALAPGPGPLLRYADPTRGGGKESANNVLVDAGVWRLGGAGRPTALVTLEIYRTPGGKHLLSYEFLSLNEAKFTLTHKAEAVRWEATASGLELKPLPDAPKPADAAPARLAQMRQAARRFGATETFSRETVECRLIAQPLDRYSSDADRVVDGAIFALANGTNPEIGVVLEAGPGGWRYGVVRLGAAEAAVTLDGRPVAAFERFDARGRRDGPYNNGAHTLDPGK